VSPIFKRELRNKWMCMRHMGKFLEYDRGRRPSTKKYYPDPIIQICHFVVQVDFWENERDKDN
jgi:hypothetical protein